MLKRSVIIAGHKTSVSLEESFWTTLKEIAGTQGSTLQDLVGRIDAGRDHLNLSSALRLFALDHVRRRAEETGPPQTAAED